MKVSVEHLSPVKRALSVEVEPSVVGDEFASAYAALGRRVKVAGFRPGKVPSRSSKTVSSRSDRRRGEPVGPTVLRPSDQGSRSGAGPAPSIEELSVSRDAPLSFRAVVEVRLAIALQPYRGLPLSGVESSSTTLKWMRRSRVFAYARPSW
jgi:trigger factor